MDLKLNSNKYIHHLLFAVGQVILVEDAGDATYMFHQLMDFYTEWSLKINTKEIEHLTISLRVDDVLEGIKINSFEKFKYL